MSDPMNLLRQKIRLSNRAKETQGRQTSCVWGGTTTRTLERFVLKGRYEDVSWELSGRKDDYDSGVCRKGFCVAHRFPVGGVAAKEDIPVQVELACRDSTWTNVGDTYYEVEVDISGISETRYFCQLCGRSYYPHYGDDRGTTKYIRK